ncbi:NB-ARC domains-containing protein [Tanacetum coccineum]
MEIVSAIIAPVMNALMVHITQKLRNLTSSAERVEHMKNRMQVLEGQRAEIEVHVGDNKVNNRRIPPQVTPWLTKVEDIKKHVDKISSNNVGCFNVIKKYKAGEGALKLTKDIEDLITDYFSFFFFFVRASPGIGSSREIRYSMSFAVPHHVMYDSSNSPLLCGMGGVGKTTLMKQLKESAKDNKMFSWIVDVGIGKFPNLHAIQKAIAAHTGEPLTETDETLMATYLSKRFKEFSEQKEKILVILDDVWKESKIKLEHIGLSSPLPNGVKLLLTSRDENICQQIAVDADSVLEVVRVNVLEEGEAQDFFSRIAGISEERDRDLYQIGCDIVKKCGCLPLAIKLIAATLKCQKKFVWRRTLKHLKKNDLDKNVQNIIKISYESLVHDDKVIFLLCGMFPEDYNIPIEDLARYAWGLKLLEQDSSMGDARDSTQTSVSNLKNAYLLMDGDSHHIDCVKLHDLVLAFVVGSVSKGGEDGCWIIHQDDFSKLSEANNMSQSCKQISLTCKGMSEFPSEFKFPNLSLLKLMHGSESLRFPLDFYEGMKKLQVIAFQNLEYPVVPTSFQCSTNLRTLCLDECSLMLDLTCIGNLLNLEVLSFANSGITILPSTFRNLKKLKLLDVTDCYNLVIDDGVLKNMVKLEEIYMRGSHGRALCLTDNNCSEFAERSENLCALEFDFIGNNAHMKNMSYEKLKRFKLALGCSFTEVRDNVQADQVDMHSYENSLKLVTNREELLTSKINDLFKFTDALYLQVNDMNTLEDIDVESPHPRHHPRNSSFYNLRFLKVTECEDLRYLFTLNVATKLSKLEYLEISRCPIMEAVIQIENNGCNIIMLSNLKYLRLAELPKLLSFSNNVNVIELPRLVELQLEGLQSFTSIYPSSASSSVSSNISRVQSFFHKEIDVVSIPGKELNDDISKVAFPSYLLHTFHHLHDLLLNNYKAVEVAFEMMSPSIRESPHNTQQPLILPYLEVLVLYGLERMSHVWKCNWNEFLILQKPQSQSSFHNLTTIRMSYCHSIKYLFSPLMAKLLFNLKEVRIACCGGIEEVVSDRDDEDASINFPTNTTFFPHLDILKLRYLRNFKCIGGGANGISTDIHDQLKLSQASWSLCQYARKISIVNCDALSSVIPWYVVGQMQKLQVLEISDCKSMTEVFETQEINNKSGTDTGKSLPRLEYITMLKLPKLKILKIQGCRLLKHIFTFSTLESLAELEELEIKDCKAMEVIVNNEIGDQKATSNVVVFPHLKSLILVNLPNFVGFFLGKNEFTWTALEKVVISECPQITVFTYGQSTAPKLKFISTSLGKHSVECGLNFHVTTTLHQARLPSYESTSSYRPTTMERLLWSYHNLINVDMDYNPSDRHTLFSYDEVSQLQKLETVSFRRCQDTEVIFDSPTVAAEIPNLRQVDLEWLSSLKYIWKSKQGTVIKFPNLTRLFIDHCESLEYIFTCSMVGSVLQLQELHISDCYNMKVIVKGEEECDAIENAIVVFPCLKSLKLYDLQSLEGFCLGKEAFEFPSLDTLQIDRCRIMTVFTKGDLSAPKLHAIRAKNGKFNIHNRLNSVVKNFTG